jgi:hypothetical protein
MHLLFLVIVRLNVRMVFTNVYHVPSLSANLLYVP